MQQTTEIKPLPPSQSVQECSAVIIALASGRFAIVYRDGPQTIRSTEMICRDVRQLSSGENVYYRGVRDQVVAIAPY